MTHRRDETPLPSPKDDMIVRFGTIPNQSPAGVWQYLPLLYKPAVCYTDVIQAEEYGVTGICHGFCPVSYKVPARTRSYLLIFDHNWKSGRDSVGC